MPRASRPRSAALSASGTRVYLQRGNRDFLLGERFARAAGATLLPDAVVHDLHGTPTLIMHGDQLCTDDVDYQRCRAFWQNPVNRRRVSRLPYVVRRGIAPAASRRQPASDREQAGGNHGRQRRRRRRGNERASRRAADPRPHAPAGAARAQHRRPRLRALRAGRLVQGGKLPRGAARTPSRPGRSDRSSVSRAPG